MIHLLLISSNNLSVSVGGGLKDREYREYSPHNSIARAGLRPRTESALSPILLHLSLRCVF